MARSTTETTTQPAWSLRNRRPSASGRTPVAPAEPSRAGNAADRPDVGGLSSERRERYEGSGIAVGVVVLLLAAACVVVVVAQNTRTVRFEFLWWDTAISLAGLLLATGLIVAVLEEIVGLAWRRRRRTMRTLTSRP